MPKDLTESISMMLLAGTANRHVISHRRWRSPRLPPSGTWC